MRRQLLNAALVAGGAGVVGWLFGYVWLGLCAGLGLYLVRQLYYVAALMAWAHHPKRVELPEPHGSWGLLYERLVARQRRNRRRRKKLLALLRQYQASTEALPDGAAVIGEQGELRWYNTAAQALLGLRGGHDLGQRLPNLLRHPDFTAYFARGEFGDEIEVPSPVNAAATLALRVVRYGEDQRLVLIRDVSELHRLERIRRDFVANASHELRTPLTVLRGYLDMMRSDATGGATPLAAWNPPLQQMHAQATRMEALIRDLLKLARLEAEVAGSRQDVIDVPAMLAQVLAESRELSAGQHTIEADIESGLHLFGRASEIESIFSNLVANAIQYTPSGGRIGVRWWGDAEGAHFSVTDTGIGVAAEDIPRLTERFYRVDAGRSRAKGGTGLGLSIVKHSLQRHEGRLRIESRPGQGSTFACDFPAHRVVQAGAIAANG